jgi:hypothetical protein
MRKKQIKVDIAIYLADDTGRTYRYMKSNPDWKKLSPAANERNRKSIEGYERIFRSGKRKIFIMKTQ